MLYKLAGKDRLRSSAPAPGIRPQSLPQHGASKDRKAWRGATRLTAEDIERQGFRLSSSQVPTQPRNG